LKKTPEKQDLFKKKQDLFCVLKLKNRIYLKKQDLFCVLKLKKVENLFF